MAEADSADHQKVPWGPVISSLFIIGLLSVISTGCFIIGIIVMSLSINKNFKYHEGKRTGTILLVAGILGGTVAFIIFLYTRKKRNGENKTPGDGDHPGSRGQRRSGEEVGAGGPEEEEFVLTPTSGGYTPGQAELPGQNGAMPYGYTKPMTPVRDEAYSTAAYGQIKF